MKTYAAIYKDNAIRDNSSSGGIFSALADKFDVVYGVAMTDDCHGAEVARIEGDISSLRGSKYVQAKVGDAFKQVKKDLEAGRSVLFSGTGCQINGLSMFLGKEYTNLFLLDIVCHGTPSPKLWKVYAEYREEKHGKLESVNFRCKGGHTTQKNNIYIPKNEDSFMRMFLRNYCLRQACYECHAKYFKKSDMTIADFWGIENVAPEMNDGRGISLVISRTEKGHELFERVKNELKWKEVSYEESVRNNPCEHISTNRPQQRDAFFEDLEKFPFAEMEKKYAADMRVSFSRKALQIIKNTIRKTLYRLKLRQRTNSEYGILLVFKK